MEFTDVIEEADAELTPYGVILVALGDADVALKVIDSLAEYAKSLRIGNNQVPAIVFFDDEVAFGAVDLWDGDEEIM